MNPVYVEGTSADYIIEDGWSRGFKIEQTVAELKAQGFTDATYAMVHEKWQQFDADHAGIVKALYGRQ